MKPGADKPAVKKTMRVVTSLTGVTACAAAFAPATPAQAATSAAHPQSKIVNLGQAGQARDFVADGSVPDQPYSLAAVFTGVSKIQVCGWHPTNDWRCTAYKTGLNKKDTYVWSNIGGNHKSWDRGAIDVYWNGGGAGNWDTCNTNGDYLGHFDSGDPYYVILSPVGPGHPEC